LEVGATGIHESNKNVTTIKQVTKVTPAQMQFAHGEGLFLAEIFWLVSISSFYYERAVIV